MLPRRPRGSRAAPVESPAVAQHQAAKGRDNRRRRGPPRPPAPARAPMRAAPPSPAGPSKSPRAPGRDPTGPGRVSRSWGGPLLLEVPAAGGGKAVLDPVGRFPLEGRARHAIIELERLRQSRDRLAAAERLAGEAQRPGRAREQGGNPSKMPTDPPKQVRRGEILAIARQERAPRSI